MRMENWSIVSIDPNLCAAPETLSLSLQGKVFGHPRFNNGHVITTSSIVGKNLKNEILTVSGSAYELGQIDQHYEDKFPNARSRLLRSFIGIDKEQPKTVKSTPPVDVEFTCNSCHEVQHIRGTLDSLLGELNCSGWPICPECGEDMEWCVVS